MARVNVMLPDDLLVQIDQVAEEEGLSRSKLLRHAMLAYFSLRDDQKEKEQRHNDIRKAIEIQDQLRKDVGPWDAIKTLQSERQKV
ncbi:MAG: CopG family ribbon-helix-helix protein [Candidatus Latescibacterota bacterium]|jgi:metal-responsive CopG/Arc/MetJ family transcriptional regulator